MRFSIFKSPEQMAREYVKQQLRNEESASPYLNKLNRENYAKRLQAGETVEALVAERLAQMQTAKAARKAL